ncbi:MAG: prephenate dehydratase domain-containing protein [Terriglobales bacterium]
MSTTDAMRIAIQGARGAFSEQAARQLLAAARPPISGRPPDAPTPSRKRVGGPGGRAAELVYCRSFEDVLATLAAAAAECALLPVENTVAGPVRAAQALLARAPVRVEAETRLRIELALIVRPGGALEQVRRASSHPVALAQCGRFLAAHPAITPEPGWDTAGSVEDMMASGDAALAAIASPWAAAVYGAEIAAAAIGDCRDNFTRFVLVRRR